MKDLDRDSIEQSKDLRALEQSYIQKLKTNNGVEDKVLLDAIDLLRNKIKQRLSEKTAIGRNLLHELDRFTRKLDTDLAFFETDLKTFGYSEQAKKGTIPSPSHTLPLYVMSMSTYTVARICAYCMHRLIRSLCSQS